MFFEKLNQLALQCPLVVTVTADPVSGRMTMVITPKLDKEAPDAALRQPLTLTATPAEFDAEFFAALDKYSGARLSLQEQVDATTEVLNAAKFAQVGKAAKATARPGRAAPSSAAKIAPADGDPDSEEATGDAGQPSPDSGTPPGEVSLFGG